MSSQSHKSIKILIVDDEESICDILKEQFELLEAKVVTAYNGKQAYEILLKEQFDIVITDVKMPNGDGIFLLKKIKETISYKPKIFICSGFHPLTDEEIISYNVIAVLDKPFSTHEFMKHINQRVT